MNKKIFYSLILVALFSAGCVKKASETQPAPEVKPAPQQTQAAPQPSGQTVTVQKTAKPDSASSGLKPAKPMVTETVIGSGLAEQPYEFSEGQTALGLLKAKHKVDTKDYGSLGEMVTGIDGVSARIDQFWAFYVNGKLADMGAGSYKLKAGDKIEWKLNSVNSYQPNSK